MGSMKYIKEGKENCCTAILINEKLLIIIIIIISFISLYSFLSVQNLNYISVSQIIALN